MKNGYKKNNLQQIRGFCAVMEEGSILQASKKMCTAQSNVSLQISSLEKVLGICLFKRKNQRLFPTSEALRYYKICKKTLSEVDFLFENASTTIKRDYDNIIKIAAHSYMLSHILPPYFKKIIETNPKVKFELHNISNEEAMDFLEHGIIDLAFYPANQDRISKSIETKKFYKCAFAIGMHKNHPLAKIPEKEITWNLLADYDFITLGKGVTAQSGNSIIASYNINSRFSIKNSTWEICSGLIKEGLTIGGTDLQYAKWHKDVILKNVPNLMPDYIFHVLQNKKTQISKSSKQLLEIMLSS